MIKKHSDLKLEAFLSKTDRDFKISELLYKLHSPAMPHKREISDPPYSEQLKILSFHEVKRKYKATFNELSAQNCFALVTYRGNPLGLMIPIHWIPQLKKRLSLSNVISTPVKEMNRSGHKSFIQLDMADILIRYLNKKAVGALLSHRHLKGVLEYAKDMPQQNAADTNSHVLAISESSLHSLIIAVFNFNAMPYTNRDIPTIHRITKINTEDIILTNQPHIIDALISKQDIVNLRRVNHKSEKFKSSIYAAYTRAIDANEATVFRTKSDYLAMVTDTISNMLTLENK